MEFYNMKTKQKVDIPESGLRKRTMVQKKNGQPAYAVTGKENGTSLVRFVSKQQYDALQVPEVEGS